MFAQRQEQYTLCDAGRLAHCGWTCAVTAPHVPGALQAGAASSPWPGPLCPLGHVTRPWKWLTRHVPPAHAGVPVSTLISPVAKPANPVDSSSSGTHGAPSGAPASAEVPSGKHAEADALVDDSSSGEGVAVASVTALA